MNRTLGVYGYVTRAVQYDIPIAEMIQSVSPFADDIHIVVDTTFEDGTIQVLENLGISQLHIHPKKLDWNNPAIDGETKQAAREFCKNDIRMSMDGDEIVDPRDVPKIKRLKEVYPDNKIIGTGVINWFNGPHIKLNAAGSVKERFTTLESDVSHGIPIQFRVPVVGTPYVRALDKSCDGAGYIDSGGNSVVPNIFLCKGDDPRRDITNSESIWIHHVSYWSLPRKWEMKKNWHLMWGGLYGKVESVEDYNSRNNPDGEPVNFFTPPIVKPHKSYLQPIRDEMNKDGTVIVKVRNIAIPGLLKKWADRQRIYIPRRWPLKDINLNMKTNAFKLGM